MRMLTASASAPNSRQKSVRSVPKPVNWHGVADGMQAARAAVRAERLEDAERILIELLDFAPSEMNAWKLLARIQRKLGHIEKGIDSAKRALELQNAAPTRQSPASATLAKLLWRQGEQPQAMMMLDQLIASRPEDDTLQKLKQEWVEETN